MAKKISYREQKKNTNLEEYNFEQTIKGQAEWFTKHYPYDCKDCEHYRFVNNHSCYGSPRFDGRCAKFNWEK